jgi:hypothetical protein
MIMTHFEESPEVSTPTMPPSVDNLVVNCSTGSPGGLSLGGSLLAMHTRQFSEESSSLSISRPEFEFDPDPPAVVGITLLDLFGCGMSMAVICIFSYVVFSSCFIVGFTRTRMLKERCCCCCCFSEESTEDGNSWSAAAAATDDVDDDVDVDDVGREVQPA